jgi:hypothetical protein
VAESASGWGDFGALCEDLAAEEHEDLDGFGVGAGGGLIDQEHPGVDEVIDCMA